MKYCDIKKKMNETDSMGLWDDKDIELLYPTMLTECRIMQGLFQRLFTLKYAEESEHEIE